MRVEVIQTDNEAEFQARVPLACARTKASATTSIKPTTPRLNGKVERFHRIDAEEFDYQLLDGVVIDDTRSSTNRLSAWENFYDCPPAPPAALDGQTPMKDSSSEPRPRCKQPPSIADLVVDHGRVVGVGDQAPPCASRLLSDPCGR